MKIFDLQIEATVESDRSCGKGAALLTPVKGRSALPRRWLAPPLTALARGGLGAVGRVGMAVSCRSKSLWGGQRGNGTVVAG